MKVIAIAAQKGGVGKTSTAFALASALHNRGKRVLAIDLDPQASLSNILGVEDMPPNIADFYCSFVDLSAAVMSIPEAFDVIASDARLWNLTDEQQARGVKRFGAALRRLSTQYDYAVIDTPPSLGGYTVAALAASDYVVAPLQVDRHAVACLRQMADTLDAIRETNEGLTFAGVLITRLFPRLKTTRILLPLIEAEAEAMGGRVFASTVRECSALRAAEIVQLDIFRYAPKSNAAADYSAFVDELLTII